MNGVRLYFRYIRLHFLSQLQYTLWPMALLTTALFVATDPLDALLRAPSAAERLHVALPSLCSSCSYRKLCGGGCPRMLGEMYMRGDSYCGYADFLDEALPTLTGIAAALCRRLRPC